MDKIPFKKSLAEVKPELLNEWDYRKNQKIDPAKVTCGSSAKVWWKCHLCGNEWQAQINNRTKSVRASGCPKCAKQKRIETYMRTKLDGGNNSLLLVDPELAEQWDYDRNGNIIPSAVNVNAKKSYWWICPECGYNWKASPCYRHREKGCPICKGHKAVWPGHNDFASQKPELLEDWDFSRNINIDPSNVRVFSSAKVWWKCHVCGYEWYCSIYLRSSGNGCAYCAGQVAIEGKNDLATTDPITASEWNYDKNGDLKPTQFKAGSCKKVWWKCKKCGHEWESPIKTRKIAGCPACAGRLRTGYNDIATLNPELIIEWNYNKNGSLTPDQITAGSNHKVWWICKTCGYEWESIVNTRTNGVGCPRCSGRVVWKGHNDFATKCADLLKEWDYEKNLIRPDEVSFRSNKLLWWKCSMCGNSYQMNAYNKSIGHGCPKCNRIYHSSFPEQAIYYYLTKAGIEAINGYRTKWLGKSEIDIFIPSLKLGIEYDGQNWHKNPVLDKQKSHLILSQGINLVRVRDPGCPDLGDDRIKTFVTNEYTSNGSYINTALMSLFQYINDTYHTSIPDVIDASVDHTVISASYENLKFSKSLSANYPNLIIDWDYNKNNGLIPEQVTDSSHVKVWWKCNKCGYSWQASIHSRSRGQGCPACSHTVAYPGVTDLATINPSVASEWNYEKNGSSVPSSYLPNSGIKVWWKCSKCGYVWIAAIKDRNKGRGCPACRKKSKKDNTIAKNFQT